MFGVKFPVRSLLEELLESLLTGGDKRRIEKSDAARRSCFKFAMGADEAQALEQKRVARISPNFLGKSIGNHCRKSDPERKMEIIPDEYCRFQALPALIFKADSSMNFESFIRQPLSYLPLWILGADPSVGQESERCS